MGTLKYPLMRKYTHSVARVGYERFPPLSPQIYRIFMNVPYINARTNGVRITIQLGSCFRIVYCIVYCTDFYYID